MKFDLTRPVQTVTGRPARIICTDRKGFDVYPLVGLVTHEDGREGAYFFDKDGRCYPNKQKFNLINMPEYVSDEIIEHISRYSAIWDVAQMALEIKNRRAAEKKEK